MTSVYTGRMNLENRFLAIKSFLIDHFDLLSTEVLENYHYLDSTDYRNWSTALNTLDSEEKIQLENELNTTNIKLPHDFKHFIERIKDLSKIPKQELSKQLIPPELKRKLSQKKQHEILQIKDFLDHQNWNKILDIGSGAGHLSSILLSDNQKSSVCIDANSAFQQIGQKKLAKDAPGILKRLNFITKEINSSSDLENINYDLLIGLHSCGDLSSCLIKSYAGNKKAKLLNFGCCYHKLSKEMLNISSLAKQEPTLEVSYHALTMAAKSYKKLSEDEIWERESVKNFRYTVHLLMEKELKMGFRPLGNAAPKDYSSDFATYCYKYLPESLPLTKEFLNRFYQQNLAKAQYIQNLGLIRSFLARPLEIYLILDRALYLKESGHNVEIQEFFDKKLSPRNIGIIAS